MKRTKVLRVSGRFANFLDELRPTLPRKFSDSELTDDMLIVMKQSGKDQEIKRLFKRRFL